MTKPKWVPATLIDTKALLAEVTAAIDPAEDVLRGLQKYLLLPLKPETASEVQALLERYERRNSLVRTLARALSDTIGYIHVVLEDPDLTVSEVPLEVSNDLDEHLALMTCGRVAIGRFLTSRQTRD